jgi:hypothetical protein
VKLGTGWETVEEGEFEPGVETGDYVDTFACAELQLETQEAWDEAAGGATEQVQRVVFNGSTFGTVEARIGRYRSEADAEAVYDALLSAWEGEPLVRCFEGLLREQTLPREEVNRTTHQARASVPQAGVTLAFGFEVTDGQRSLDYRFERYLWTNGTLVAELTFDGPFDALPEQLVLDTVQWVAERVHLLR